MSTAVIGAFEAKTHLSALLDRVERGEEVVITKHGRPVARLLPVARPAPQAQVAVERLLQIGGSQRLDTDWRLLRDEGRR